MTKDCKNKSSHHPLLHIELVRLEDLRVQARVVALCIMHQAAASQSASQQAAAALRPAGSYG